MESLSERLKRRRTLGARVRALEEEIQECREVNLRVAELCDVVMELLIPIEARDEAAIREILDRYRTGVGDPLRP